jgi:hypothetical protein
MQNTTTPDPVIEKVIELLSEYHDFVRQFFEWDDKVSRASNRLHASVGISEEVVELIEEIEEIGIVDFSKAIEEAGDVMFYIMLYKISTDTKEDIISWFIKILRGECEPESYRTLPRVTHVTAKLLGCDKKMYFKRSIDPVLRVNSSKYLKLILVWMMKHGCVKFDMNHAMAENMKKLTLRHKV